ncbi:MAG TPA: hypothetical protein VFS39_09150 [Nitrospira sp.]|nr:hypothetical protein [Nitrospira sp.]
MKHQDRRDLVTAFQRLTDIAEQYVNRSPKVKRIQAERGALLDAIAEAQLLLSVQRLPKDPPAAHGPEPNESSKIRSLEEKLKESEGAFRQLRSRLGPIATALGQLQMSAQDAKNLLDTAISDAELSPADAIPLKTRREAA